jgi:hypothetical protein
VLMFFPTFLLLPQKHRAPMLFAGLLNGLTGPFSALLEGRYWSPVRVGGMSAGFEDVLIGFALGSTAWGVAVWPHRHRTLHHSGIGGFASRLPRPLSYLFPFVGLHFLGLSWMSAFLATLLSVIIVELSLRPAMWPVALSGALLFPPLYVLYFTLVFALWPEFLLQWNPAPPWGRPVLGLPLGELVWSILFGGALPLIVASILGVRRISD